MTLNAAVGYSSETGDREAAIEAAQGALKQLGRSAAVVGWVIQPVQRQAPAILSGLAEVLGDTPLLGFSASAGITSQGLHSRSVVVGLLAGDELSARANWWPEYSHNSQACAQTMQQVLSPVAQADEFILVAADGLNGDVAALEEVLWATGCRYAGCLAGGDLLRGRTFQVGGRQVGQGGLAAAVLGGAELAVGLGLAHGWKPAGMLARVTQAQGLWLRELDHQPSAEVFASWFGNSSQDWMASPLSEMIRLYPLGFGEAGEQAFSNTLEVRSAVRVEADGSLRLNIQAPEAKTAALLVASPESCLEAARIAAGQARENLGSARPVLAILLIDAAWQVLLELDPGAEIRAVQSILGGDVPILGGYTLGQLMGRMPGGRGVIQNQAMLVILLGQQSAKS